MGARKYPARRESWGAVRKLPSGRYQASYVGLDDVRHTAPKTFDNLGDARTWLTLKRSEIARSEWRPVAKHAPITFGEYAREYVETRTVKGRPLKPSTRSGYLDLIDGSLAVFGDVRLDKITPEAVRRWHSELVKTGKRTQSARAYQVLRAVLAQAVKDRRLTENPAQIDGALKANTGRTVKPPTDAELAIIVATIDPRLALMVEIAAWGGLRWSELTELRRGDVEIETGTDGTAYAVLAVVRAATRVDGSYIVGTPKSAAGVRTVALPPTLTAAVRERIAGLTDDALLFPSLTDPTKHMHSGSFASYWRPARAAAGRPDLAFHALRHYGLTEFARAGATVKELLTRAGHNDVATALRYQHEMGRDAELAARMGMRGPSA